MLSMIGARRWNLAGTAAKTFPPKLVSGAAKSVTTGLASNALCGRLHTFAREGRALRKEKAENIGSTLFKLRIPTNDRNRIANPTWAPSA